MSGRINLTRRAVIAGTATGLAMSSVLTSSAAAQATDELADIERRIGGRIGVTALDTRDGAHIAYHADERFAMCSSFKWTLVAAVLSRIDHGEFNLNRRVRFSSIDLLGYSPRTKTHVSEGSLPVSELCAAAVEVSDSAAANLLLKLIGGPQSVTHYLRQLGDPTTRLDRTEMALNSNIPGDDRDTTTPRAIIETMKKILIDNALSSNSRGLLVGWMKACQTGRDRLRAGLPLSWIEGDKTGTGVNGAAVDNAIVWPAGRPPILIAAYLSGSTGSSEALNKAHAEIATVIARKFA
jgi:beta-lactamase class A